MDFFEANVFRQPTLPSLHNLGGDGEWVWCVICLLASHCAGGYASVQGGRSGEGVIRHGKDAQSAARPRRLEQCRSFGTVPEKRCYIHSCIHVPIKLFSVSVSVKCSFLTYLCLLISCFGAKYV